MKHILQSTRCYTVVRNPVVYSIILPQRNEVSRSSVTLLCWCNRFCVWTIETVTQTLSNHPFRPSKQNIIYDQSENYNCDRVTICCNSISC